jgi:hypothetical protein
MHSSPPSAASLALESTLAFSWWDYACFRPLAALMWAALGRFLASWLTQADWRVYPVLLGSMTLLLASNVSVQQCRWWSLLWMRRPLPRPSGRDGGWGWRRLLCPTEERLAILEARLQQRASNSDHPPRPIRPMSNAPPVLTPRVDRVLSRDILGIGKRC